MPVCDDRLRPSRDIRLSLSMTTPPHIVGAKGLALRVRHYGYLSDFTCSSIIAAPSQLSRPAL